MAAIAWETPVVHDPGSVRRAQSEVERLAAKLIAGWEQHVSMFGLIEGKVGVAFTLFELAAAGLAEVDDHAERALVAAVEQFNSSGANPGLHAGVAGLGWLVDAWLGEEDLCGPIDDSLREKVSQMKNEPNIGLRLGLSGIGLYAVRRAPRVASARLLLEEISQTLTSSVRRAPEGLTWNTSAAYLKARGAEGFFATPQQNIREYGSAHGVAPLCLLLSQLEKLRVPAASPVVETLRWVWGSTKAEPNRFGYAVGDSTRVPLNTFTWCTGDPGTALPCWLAATSSDLHPEADHFLTFGRSLAQRIVDGERPGLEGRIDLCCGLSGVLQVFSGWAAMSGDPLFAEASRVLLKRLLDELAGFELSRMSLDLQFGIGGVAATLLAQVNGKAPSWAGPLAMVLPDVKQPPTQSHGGP